MTPIHQRVHQHNCKCTQSAPDGTLRVSSGPTAFLNESVMTPEGVGVDGRKLRVLFNATALRIVWNGKTAIGVEVNNATIW